MDMVNRKWADKTKELIVEESEMEVIIYFHPHQYQPPKEKLQDLLGTLICAGYCIGGDLDRFEGGEIRFYLNPVIQSSESRDTVIEQVTSLIRSSIV